MDEFDYVPGLVPSPFTSTAAPKLDRKDELEEIDVSVKQQEPGREPEKELNALRRLFVMIAAALAFTLMMSGVMFINNQINASLNQIENLNSEIMEAQAENVRLRAEFSSMVSADKVREYAVSTLGMQKIERYQIHYFENRSGNTVVVANGKVQNEDIQ